jgi:hypothetical protein
LRIKAPRSSKNESAIRKTIKAKADGAKAFINAICIDDSEPSEILAASAKLYGRKLVAPDEIVTSDYCPSGLHGI